MDNPQPREPLDRSARSADPSSRHAHPARSRSTQDLGARFELLFASLLRFVLELGLLSGYLSGALGLTPLGQTT